MIVPARIEARATNKARLEALPEALTVVAIVPLVPRWRERWGWKTRWAWKAGSIALEVLSLLSKIIGLISIAMILKPVSLREILRETLEAVDMREVALALEALRAIARERRGMRHGPRVAR